MQFFYKEKKVRNGYITAFGLLMISYFLVFLIIHQMEKRAKLVNHTNEVINNLDILLSCIKDAETNFRGYVILRDTALLESYYYQLVCVNSSFDALQKLVANDSLQLQNMDSLYTKVNAKRNILSLTIDEVRSGLITDQQVLHDRISQSSRIMDGIRRKVFQMQTYESEILSRRTNEFETISRTLKIVHFTTFVIALLLVIYSMIVFNHVSLAKRHYREQLEEGIEKLKTANNDLINLRSIEKFAASGRIARAIAHEVRNPLTSISLATEQLKPIISSEEKSTLLDIIGRNINRINDLVLELLNSTKFSHLKLSKLSLNTIVDEALELAKDRIELHGIKVERHTTPNPCYVEVDKEKLKTAFLNLLINAIEAMEPGKGILELTTLRRDGKCIVLIRDNGVGMNDSALSRIFEPYFTQKVNGSGLGLTLTQNIILNHKGNISVESKEGKGTLFTITLNEAAMNMV